MTYSPTITPSDAVESIQTIVAQSGLFSPDELEGFSGMIPDLLADPDQHWININEDGAAYFAEDAMVAGVWNLWFIATLPKARGMGVGRALLAAVERAAKTRNGRILVVETSAGDSTARARQVYQLAGFKVVGQVPDFYAEGDDKVIFSKSL